jgi:dUTP pyrophosphatase
LDLPKYETAGSAGMDIQAANLAPVVLEPQERALIPTGMIFEIESGFEVQIRPRSGLAFKHGITCLNTPGTIDSDYRGEVMVLVINLGELPYEIERGMRIAQMVTAPVTRADLQIRTLANPTNRGDGGFGSTGI